MHRWYNKWNGTARWLLVFVALALVGGGTLAATQLNASAAIAPTVLGTAQSFAVLGGSTVTNTGPTVITGANLGVSPGSAITGFPPGIVTAPGTIHATDAVAAQAQSDVTTAYNVLAGQSCSTNLATELGGLTLTAGTYCQATAGLTGALTLDAQGNPNAVFVFKVASTLITASNSSVRVINGGSACNVYWQVGSSATLGTNTAFVGSILALTSISVNTGATVAGRALARNGAVTLDNNRFTPSVCSTTPINTPTNTPTLTPTNTPTLTPTNTPTNTPTSPSTPTNTPPQPPAGQPPAGQPPVGQPVAAQPVTVRPVVIQPAIGPGTGGVGAAASNGQGANGNASVSGSMANAAANSGSVTGPGAITAGNAPGSGGAVTGTTDTTAPISATLPLVGSPANAAATAPPIPVAMSNTGGGGMATHFTTPTGGVGDSGTTRLLWLGILAALVTLASTGLLFFKRMRR